MKKYYKREVNVREFIDNHMSEFPGKNNIVTLEDLTKDIIAKNLTKSDFIIYLYLIKVLKDIFHSNEELFYLDKSKSLDLINSYTSDRILKEVNFIKEFTSTTCINDIIYI